MQGQIDQLPRPTNYFELMEKVGTGGKYQFNMMLIFILVWFVTGIILMSTAFLFLNPDFQCLEMGLLVDDCYDYVCSLPADQWKDFVPEANLEFKSLATAFGQYYCDDEIYLQLTSTFAYLGAFLGYIFISFFSDNFGRRQSMLLSWGIATAGTIFLCISQNLYMAAVGLFLCGFGGDASTNLTIFYFGQVVENAKRQKYSVFVMAFFCGGSIIISIFFYWLHDWFLVTIIVLAVPALITFLAFWWYVEQTPCYLVKKGIMATMKALNRIGKINKNLTNLVQQADVQNVLDNQMVQLDDILITPIDLFRFASLRTITICCSIIAFITYAMYYGPILIVDQIGFDIYTSNIIVNLADLSTYAPNYYFIEKTPRRLLGMVLFAISTIMAAILSFNKKPDDCDFCSQSIIELILVFVFRFCISMEFTVFILYAAELYPGRARALGNGIVSSFGTVASTISPLLLGVFERADISPMIFFTVIGIIGIGIYALLQETMGMTIKQEIDQMQLMKATKRSQRQGISQLAKDLAADSQKNQTKDPLI